MGKNQTDTVARKWSVHEPTRNDLNFNMSPVFVPHKIAAVFGREYVDKHSDNLYFAEDIFVEKYLKKRDVHSILSLCCGFGRIERRIVKQLGGVDRCIGIDIAHGALASAKKAAAADQLDCISYRCSDLNQWKWEKDAYDLVIAHGALHHLKNLETVLDGIHYSLKPDGMLYSHEYLGLPFFDCTPRQLQLINAVAHLVPPDLRMHGTLPFSRPQWLFRIITGLQNTASGLYDDNWPVWKKTAAAIAKRCLSTKKSGYGFGIVRVSPKEIVARTDPSEGVRAPEIIPLMKERFTNVEVMPSGGGILELALDRRFYAGFDPENPAHLKLADILWGLECHYSETGDIGPHNAYIFAG